MLVSPLIVVAYFSLIEADSGGLWLERDFCGYRVGGTTSAEWLVWSFRPTTSQEGCWSITS